MLLFNSEVRFRRKIFMHCWNINRSCRGLLFWLTLQWSPWRPPVNPDKSSKW